MNKTPHQARRRFLAHALKLGAAACSAGLAQAQAEDAAGRKLPEPTNPLCASLFRRIGQ